MILLVALNAYVPRRFRWKEEMSGLSLLNRQIFQVHAVFICIVLLFFAALTLLFTRSLLDPAPLARAVLTGMGVFWFCRMLTQWFVYDSRIWRGKRFFTAMHLLFSGLWCYCTGTFAYALLVSFTLAPR
jgi:hypothetical protein